MQCTTLNANCVHTLKIYMYHRKRIIKVLFFYYYIYVRPKRLEVANAQGRKRKISSDVDFVLEIIRRFFVKDNSLNIISFFSV